MSKPKPNASSDIGARITAIGDSVMLDIKPYLEKQLPGIVVDGKVGRKFVDGVELINRLKSDGKLGDIVIIELGTNGAFSDKKLRGLLDSLADMRQVLLINSRVPRDWQDIVNDTLTSVAKDYPNTTLVDWYSLSANHDEYFAKDGVHLETIGSHAYVSLIVKSLFSNR
jgi:hypothetical protein